MIDKMLQTYRQMDFSPAQMNRFVNKYLMPNDFYSLHFLLQKNVEWAKSQGKENLHKRACARLITSPLIVPLAFLGAPSYLVRGILRCGTSLLDGHFYTAVVVLIQDASKTLQCLALTVIAVFYAVLGLVYGSKVYSLLLPQQPIEPSFEEVIKELGIESPQELLEAYEEMCDTIRIMKASNEEIAKLKERNQKMVEVISEKTDLTCTLEEKNTVIEKYDLMPLEEGHLHMTSAELDDLLEGAIREQVLSNLSLETQKKSPALRSSGSLRCWMRRKHFQNRGKLPSAYIDPKFAKDQDTSILKDSKVTNSAGRVLNRVKPSRSALLNPNPRKFKLKGGPISKKKLVDPEDMKNIKVTFQTPDEDLLLRGKKFVTELFMPNDSFPLLDEQPVSEDKAVENVGKDDFLDQY